MGIDLAYLKATLDHVTAQEVEAAAVKERAFGARLVVEAMIAKLEEDAKAEQKSESGGEG